MKEQPKYPDVAAAFSKLLEILDMNAAQFAKRVGVTPQAISNYVVGRNEPGRKMMAAILHAFPAVNASWLATGEGNPLHHGHSGNEQRPMPRALRDAVAKEEGIQLELISGLTSGPATVAEAENILLRQQVDNLTKTVDRLWGLIPAKLGKMLSNLEAAGALGGGQLAPLMH